MLDLSHIPSQQQQNFTFYSLGAGVWQTWNKPRNAKMIEIFCLGGGAGGSIATVGTGGRNGGNGGGAGGIVRGIIPAFLLPDTLYILVGKGGVGSTTNNTAGGVGGISYIGLQPSINEQTLICKSSTTAPNNTATGATISTVALSAFGNLGLFTAIAGVGANTGTSGAGASQAALGTSLVTGGAAGGGKGVGTFFSGGNITSASAILTSQVNGGVANAQDGDSGYGTLIPFCGTGGAGGAGRQGDLGAGGRGGNGFYGCGGGGNGGGQTVTGTKGGNGGDGLVIITVIT